MTFDEFADSYYKYISCIISENGFPLKPLYVLDDKNCLSVCALDLDPEQSYRYFWSIISGVDKTIRSPQYVILGLDRTTKPGQGTEFADVLTCVCWWNDPMINWGHLLKVGVINYQPEPRIVRPWDWNNSFWDGVVRREARQTVPPFRIKVEHK